MLFECELSVLVRCVKRIAIYGTGIAGKKILGKIKTIELNKEVVFLVTNDSYRTESLVCGVPVVTLNEWVGSNTDDTLVLLGKGKFVNEMVESLSAYRITNYVVVSNLEVAVQLRGGRCETEDEAVFHMIDILLSKIKDLARFVKPVNREDCFDRYYINDFVKRNRKYICGDVLEFAGGDVTYAKIYGDAPRVRLMAGLCHKDIYMDADYYADLDDSATLPEKKFDCIIATQVIMYMNEPRVALENLKRMLKPGGVLICTVPGPLFHHSKGSHHMFSFTEESIKYLCNEVFGGFEDFMCYGDLTYAEYMLFWMKRNPYVKPGPLDYQYTLVMGITSVKMTE